MKQFKKVLIINLLLILIFVFSDYWLWNQISPYPVYARVSWNPFNILGSRHIYEDGTISTITQIYNHPNFPFMLFFISTAVNLYCISKAYKVLDDKKNNAKWNASSIV